MDFPPLYRESSAGKPLIWCIRTEGADIVVQAGQIDGKKTPSRKTAKPKNVGRANATTAEEQGELEARAEWEKKKKTKYVESLDQIHVGIIKPMLAPNDAWEDTKKYAILPGDAQPKSDGVRCLAYRVDGKVVLMSRNRD